jgi:hypothetical protein
MRLRLVCVANDRFLLSQDWLHKQICYQDVLPCTTFIDLVGSCEQISTEFVQLKRAYLIRRQAVINWLHSHYHDHEYVSYKEIEQQQKHDFG